MCVLSHVDNHNPANIGFVLSPSACSVADFVITYHAIQTLDIYGPAETRVLLDVVPLLVTNIVASVLVGIKVW